MIGAIGEGLTVSAENHRQADERSTPPGHPTSQPFPKRTRWDAPAIRELPPIAGDPRAWLPEPMQDVWPSYDDRKATPIVLAYDRAAKDLRGLFDRLYGTLRSHLENNESDDIHALDEFFDRVAGHSENTLFTAFPNLLTTLAEALNDYCNEVSRHAHDLRDAIEKAAKDMGVMLLIDVILAAFTDGLSFAAVQPEGAAVLVRATPRILEIATEIAADSAAASDAAKNTADIFATAVNNTPEPDIEAADAVKLADNIEKNSLPDLRIDPVRSKRSSSMRLTLVSRHRVDRRASKNSRRQFGFIHSPGTQRVANGKYRGQDAILNYDPDTGLCVVQKPPGEFVSGWKLTPAQLKYVIERGTLGGG